MKKTTGFTLILFGYMTRIGRKVFHPLVGMPVPDFNYQYDETML
jgi:hypothetical protein